MVRILPISCEPIVVETRSIISVSSGSGGSCLGLGIGAGLRCVMVPGVGSMGGRIGLVGEIGSGSTDRIGSIGSDVGRTVGLTVGRTVGLTVGLTVGPLPLAVANAFAILDVTPFAVVFAGVADAFAILDLTPFAVFFAGVAMEGTFESEVAALDLFLVMILDNFFVYSFFFKSSFFFKMQCLNLNFWLKSGSRR